VRAPHNWIRIARGGTLVLVTAVTLGILLVIFFGVIIYQQLFTEQREGQTAIDAAALAVANELASVKIVDPAVGPVGVVDSLQNNQITKRPVYGINTLVARARLDSVFATRLGKDSNTPNKTMLFLANQDAIDVKGAAERLGNAVKTLGQDAKLKKIAVQAYNANNRRATGQGNIKDDQVTVEIGYLGGDGSILSNIPIPTTGNANHFSGGNQDKFSTELKGRRFYRANMDIPVTNAPGKFVLSPVGDAPRLVDRIGFTANAPDPMVVPTVVKVTVRESLERTNPNDVSEKLKGTRNEVACACAGGSRVPTTAGIFRLEFPQGLPQDTKAPNANIFQSVRTIMNASDMGSGDTPWSGKGTLFTAKGGSFPGKGSIGFSQIPKNGDPGNGLLENPNPSVALATYVYHWLRNDGLRPNVDATIAAFDASLRDPSPTNKSFPATANVPRGAQTIIAFNGVDDILIQKAWAASSPAYCQRIFGAIFDLEPNGTLAMGNKNLAPADPRSLSALAKNPSNAQALANAIKQSFVFAMQASTPQQLAFADPGAIATGISDDGTCPTSTDGNPLSEVADFVQALGRSQDVSTKTYDNAYGTFYALQAERDALAEPMNKLEKEIADLDAVLARTRAGALAMRCWPSALN